MRETAHVTHAWISVEKTLFTPPISMKIGHVNAFDFFYLDRKHSAPILSLIKAANSTLVHFKGL